MLDEHLDFGLKLPNIYNPEKPLNSKVILSLDNIDVEDNCFTHSLHRLVIYSIQNKIVSAKGVTNSEIRIIEID